MKAVKDTVNTEKKFHILPERIICWIVLLVMLLTEAAFIMITAALDVLPARYFIAVLAAIAAMDFVIMILMASRSPKWAKRIIGIILAIMMCAVMGLGTYYMYSTYQTLQKISAQNERIATGNKDITMDPFNVCITGIDIWGSIDQQSRSDVNMITTVNPEKREILLTSMPRDSYVVLHSFGEYDKLTHAGFWGVDETVETIQDWLDVDLDYYIRVNFSMVEDIVDAIDGVDVYNDRAFTSAIKDYDYPKGWIHLKGKHAVYFVRERKAFKEEDQKRIINQQKVMKACLKKVMSSKTLLTSYTKLLAAVDDEMQTNMSQKEMTSLVKMQLDDMRKWDIKMQSVQGDLTMKGTYTMGMGRDLLVSIPREKSVEKVKKGIREVMKTEGSKADE